MRLTLAYWNCGFDPSMNELNVVTGGLLSIASSAELHIESYSGATLDDVTVTNHGAIDIGDIIELDLGGGAR